MIVDFEITGVEELTSGLSEGVVRLQMYVARQMGIEMLELRNYVVTEKLHGPTGATTLKQRTGNLARSITSEVSEDTSSVTGQVGVPTASTAQAYARILHDGGTTRAHVIEAENGKALAFMMNGQMTFRRKVNHPGSNIPARPYLVSALEEQIAQIKESLAGAVMRSQQ